MIVPCLLQQVLNKLITSWDVIHMRVYYKNTPLDQWKSKMNSHYYTTWWQFGIGSTNTTCWRFICKRYYCCFQFIRNFSISCSDKSCDSDCCLLLFYWMHWSPWMQIICLSHHRQYWQLSSWLKYGWPSHIHWSWSVQNEASKINSGIKHLNTSCL